MVKNILGGQLEANGKIATVLSNIITSLLNLHELRTHISKFFPKPLLKLRSVHYLICQPKNIILAPKAKYKNASVGNLKKNPKFSSKYIDL